MTPNENVKKWLAAGGMCCLGVYLDLIDPDGWVCHLGEYTNRSNNNSSNLSSSKMLFLAIKQQLYNVESTLCPDFGLLAQVNDQSSDYSNAIVWIKANLLEKENDNTV